MSKNPELMRYQTDRFSSALCLVAIALNACFLISIYSNKNFTPDIQLGADVLFNIIFMMVVFLISEKVKIYSISANLAAFALGGVQLLRTGWLPEKYLAAGSMIDSVRLIAEFNVYYLIVSWLHLSALCLAAAGVIGFIKSARLRAHMKKQERSAS